MAKSRVTGAPKDVEKGQAIVDAWRTNNRVTTYLIENLPPELWSKNIPGVPRRTIRTIAAHIHNARCMWIKMIGGRHGVVVPKSVDWRTVTPAELSRALAQSSRGMVDLIRLGVSRDGAVPPAAWQNFPTDLLHFITLFRRTRGTSSRTVVHARTATGPPVTRGRHERAVAMETAVAGVSNDDTYSPKFREQRLVKYPKSSSLEFNRLQLFSAISAISASLRPLR